MHVSAGAGSEGQWKTNRSDCHHTLLLPEIPPVHLSALPGSTPGPGSFHYWTTAGHSRQAEAGERQQLEIILTSTLQLFTPCQECETMRKHVMLMVGEHLKTVLNTCPLGSADPQVNMIYIHDHV